MVRGFQMLNFILSKEIAHKCALQETSGLGTAEIIEKQNWLHPISNRGKN